MPSVRVRALPQRPSADIPGALAALQQETAEILGAPRERVRVLWQTVEPGLYLQAGEPPEVQPRDSHPPTVELVAFAGRDEATISRALERIAAVLSSTLDLDAGNAWVSYVELASGRLYVDGAIKRS